MFCSFNHRVWFLIRLDCKWSCRKVDTLSHSVSIILKWNCFYKYVYASRMFKCNSFISLATVDVPIALSWLAVDFKTTNLCLCKPAVHLVLWNLLCHQYEGSPSIETSSHPRETLDGHFCSISEMRGNTMFQLERTLKREDVLKLYCMYVIPSQPDQQSLCRHH